MTFRTNLQYLRSRRNMTQEQLAMLLGVSRQAISKWESEKAYPEMDKLLTICDLFGCTLDDLVLGDVAHPTSPESAAAPVGVVDVATATVVSDAGTDAVSLPKDLTGYDEHRRRFALLIASGVAAIIASVGVAGLFDPEHSILGPSPLNDFLAFACICVGVIVGLALLIPAAVSHEAFKRRHPYVEDFYTEDDRGHESRLLAAGVVAGVAEILVGIAIVVYAGDVLGIDAGWPNAIMLLLDAVAVFGFVYFGLRRGLLNIDAYNEDAETERRKREGTLPFSARLAGAVFGIIMLVATIIGLTLLFLGVDDHLFWIPWPIGGLLCAITGIVIGLFKDRLDR
ncbi:helix-turn-helix transcriptional regulator [Bifidobacterium simiarum]|uniref:XRE family transcriptional regulator n=1 Tax=Bifidobacterium simiarum TaxID=2045441 RepID=A0A2M9HG47_9BIFI|nr:helix-turn-helix transcriptional regulator [Bifidobacterium simiarum]PJM75753.1 XRE family transcriptional regulator [Bifidobacterium simiarum]